MNLLNDIFGGKKYSQPIVQENILYVDGWDDYLKKHIYYTGILENSNKDVAHCVNGQIHREDGPAVLLESGYEIYYKHGVVHREDGPAIINKKYNIEHYYIDGKEVKK